MRIGFLAATIFISASAFTADAESELCRDPGAFCGDMISAACLERLGAGPIAAADGDCAHEVTNYRNCVANATACAGAQSTAGDRCDNVKASELWRIAETMGDSGGYRAFLASCPKALEAPFATAKLARLKCRDVAAATPDLGAFKECDACPEMVVAPAGSFEMGSTGGSSSLSPHRVRLPRFAIARTETTG